ncbi:hypothetical protein ACHAXS_009326 [Conticribra weissflogii]
MSSDIIDEVGSSYHSYKSAKSDPSKTYRNRRSSVESMHQTGKKNQDSKITAPKSGGYPSFHYLQHHASTPSSPETSTMKTSSIGSSSTGSRRRQKERERSSRNRFNQNGGDNDRAPQGERISAIDEAGGDFLRDLDRSDSSRGKGSHENSFEWSDRLEGMPPIPPHQPAQGLSNQYHYVQPQQQLPQQQQRAVLHACDEKTGKCLFHPHITLRKKAILGVMGGWKDVLRACPECEAEDLMRLTGSTSNNSGESLPQPVPSQIPPLGETRRDSGDHVREHHHRESGEQDTRIYRHDSGEHDSRIYRRDSGEHDSRDYRREAADISRDHRRISVDSPWQPPLRRPTKVRSRTLSPIDRSRKRLGRGHQAPGIRRPGDRNTRRRNSTKSSSSSDSSEDSDEDDDDSDASSSTSSSSLDYRSKSDRRPVQSSNAKRRSGAHRSNGNNNNNSLSGSLTRSKENSARGGFKKSLAKVTRPWMNDEGDASDTFITSYISGGVASQDYTQSHSRRDQKPNHHRSAFSNHLQSQQANPSSRAKSPPNSGSADINRKMKKGVSKMIRKGKKSLNNVKSNMRHRPTSSDSFDSSVGENEVETGDEVEYFYDVDEDDGESNDNGVAEKSQKLEPEEEAWHRKQKRMRQQRERKREHQRKEPLVQLKRMPLVSSVSDDLQHAYDDDGIRVHSEAKSNVDNESLLRSSSDPNSSALKNAMKLNRKNSADYSSPDIPSSTGDDSNGNPVSKETISEYHVTVDDQIIKKRIDEEREKENELLRQEFLRERERQRIKEEMIQRQSAIDTKLQEEEDEAKQNMLRFMEKQRQQEDEERVRKELLEEEERKRKQMIEEENLRKRKLWEEENLRYFEQRIKEELAEKKRREKLLKESQDQVKSNDEDFTYSPKGSVKSIHTHSTTKSGETKLPQNTEEKFKTINEERDIVNGKSQVGQNEETISHINISASPSMEPKSMNSPSSKDNTSSNAATSEPEKATEKEGPKAPQPMKNDDGPRLLGDQSMKIKLTTLDSSKSEKGILNIDLTALQPSKQKADSRSSKFGGFDVSSLQPSRLSKSDTDKSHSEKSHSEKSHSSNDDSIKIDRAALQPRKKEKVKTFEVSNLPWTGRFGDSGYYTGSVNEQYEPYGRGTMLYDNGIIRKGHWKDGDFVRESEGDSDSEDDEENNDGPANDLTSSMADLSFGKTSKYASRDRSRSRSRSKDRAAPPKPLPPEPEPEPETVKLPSYKIGEIGKKEDMITDKKEALEVIEKLDVGDGAFIRRSDGKWTYAILKKREETEGGPAIRFTVNERKSSKSYNKKYWESHIRPMKSPKLNIHDKSSDNSVSSAADREGRSKQRDPAGTLSRQPSSSSISSTSSASDDNGRGVSCPPVQSKAKFEWPKRNFRSRSRSRRRAVSCSPMRQMFSITESDAEDEDEEGLDPVTQHHTMLGANLGMYALRGIDP